MKNCFFLLPIFGLHFISFSQNLAVNDFGKPSLDISVFDSWPSIRKFGISNDGKFIYYTTIYGVDPKKQFLTVKSLSGHWETNIHNIDDLQPIDFTKDDKQLICMNSGDSLCLITLGKTDTRFISGVQSFNLFEKDSLYYLIYKKISPGKELIFQDLKNNNEKVIKHVADYVLSEQGSKMIIKIDSAFNGVQRQFLFWNYIAQTGRNIIAEDNAINSTKISKTGEQIAFVKETNGLKSIWLYKAMSRAVQVLCDSSKAIGYGLQIESISGFNEDGSKLFIYLKEKALQQPKPGAIKLNVWSYTDTVVQSGQLRKLTPQVFLAAIDLKNHNLSRLQYENETVWGSNSNFIFLTKRAGDNREYYWNATGFIKAFLVSKNDASRIQLRTRSSNSFFSPDGKYVITVDERGRDLFCYAFETGKTINLTKALSINLPADNLQRDSYDYPAGKYSRGLNFAGWGEGDKVLIYDEFDIWEIDLREKKVPVNLTNGFGRKNKIEFRLMDLHIDKSISLNDGLIVRAFNKLNKNSGFYEIKPGKVLDPNVLSMDDYLYKSVINIQSPIKAKDADIFLVARESATKSSNIYWTKDFKTFNLVTSVFPEREYNWLTSELKTFKVLDGRTELGVLYKPINFDAHKKYPVIIHYYENKSDELNKFPNPRGDNDGGQLDISWFVSHGYIVFTPDIHYKIGDPGRSAYNSIIGASEYLKTLPFVNPAKIGLQGHSWGGYETNYIVANSHVFAAAIASSGPSNFITGYLSDNLNEQWHNEVMQHRLGKSLWEDIPMYVVNSPVFKAYNVTTPIMLVHNKIDNNVPFIQGLEWFMALRRLGKRAWMLQYDDGGHGVDGDDYIDYVIRSTQFFDHYLKGSACPTWMLYGVPAKMKGLDDGLELVREKDKKGKWLTPKVGGLLIDEQKKTVMTLSRKK